MTTTKPKAHGDDDLAKGSVNSAYSLIGLQVLSRLATFTLNQLLLRLASPKVFGTAAIQLDLLLSTVLFLSREGVRNALLRVPRDSSGSTKITNVSTIPALLGAPLAFGLTLVYRSFASPATRAQPYFDQAVSIYALAALIDLVSEPLHNRAQSLMRFNLRVKAEGTAIITRSVCTVVALMVGGERWSLVAFAAGQLAYAMTVLVVYAKAFWREGRVQIFPRRVYEDGKSAIAFDPTSLKLALTMTGQSVFKHFLTEGDRIVISRVSPLEDQGGYAVASNYGSLVARILFQPIEESTRLYFSKTLSPPPEKDSIEPAKPSETQLSQAAVTLQSILFLHFHLALALTALLAPLVPFLSEFLLPPRYRSTAAPRILRAYCAYIPAMGLNGILEAFVHATALPTQLRSQARWMVIFSIAFAVSVSLGASGALGTKWDDTMLIWANVANLGARALYGWIFARKYFGKGLLSLRLVRPCVPGIVAFGLAGLLARWSEENFDQRGQRVKHAGVCIGCGVVSLAIWYVPAARIPRIINLSAM
ncbi:oligosaccharide translocation protein Rft1 [Rhizoctonia solani AG-3 Rhs1AP]|uniref:Man(5)GlcNAc(2)-PP-dolichol translocation protein RFT1 n=1 Tax=Rhizoctonia solani AG-3 Rhs1AP TaxID=1086054 RepID=A0A0A1UKJ6_9AGAM|nr:oligosaccharide translocation protein Rft1 [Rhizoctonia solani AG-3 Rhs1AP]